ncbi:hypothetical protein NYE59_22975 [Paenibacillus sp. FSL L8-0323]|uniref:hypothetical protein n=1 Tax=Paenibacillus sp. FSL L8-0323 TaxID=2975330 RepID=UPI0030FBBB1C
MTLKLDFVLKSLRDSGGSPYETAIRIIKSEIRGNKSPFAKVRSVKIVLDALDSLNDKIIN